MANEAGFYNIPVSGSLAYDFTAVPSWPERGWGPRRDEEKVVIPAAPRTQERVAAGARVKSRQTVSPAAVLGFLCAAILLVFTLMAKIQLTEVTDQAVMLETRLAELETEQARLLIEYESAFNFTEIEEYATNMLGMQRPREEQMIYLHSAVPDKAVVLNSSAEKDKSLSEEIAEVFDFIGEYFR